jgi:hypothetical protein
MTRVSEGYSLGFSNGGGTSGTGVPIKENDVIETQDKTSSARVVMTPILTSGTWAARNAAGTFVLANIVTGTTAIAGGVPLYVNGERRATATGGIDATKNNYLRVYYTRPTALGTANAVETDNNRLANPRNSVNWPPDDLTELAAGNDYVTLVQWTDTKYSQGAEMAPSITAGNWTLGTGWTIASSQLRKSANGTGTARPNPALAITAGVTYDVSITVTNRTAGSFSYTLGGVSGGTISTNDTHTNAIKATGTANLIITPTNTSRFYITAISIKPRTNTIVPVTSTSEANAIIKEGDLVTPAWTSASTTTDFRFVAPSVFRGDGDNISLTTSSGTATSTSYDDFAIQLDKKAGAGFLPPIQQ